MKPESIILYDGVCGFCNGGVRWLIEHEAAGRLHYAPLQGETAARMRTLHPEIPATLESVVLIDDGRVHLRSKAFLYGARYLDPPWRWAYAFRWLPAAVLDVVYNADLQWNLGRALLAAERRSEAHAAFIKGLRLQRDHRGIILDLKKMGIRRKPPLPFLDRSNPLNVWLGLRRRD